MKTMLLATAAILGMATAGAALADQAQVKFPQTAVLGQPQANAARPGVQLAQGAHPNADTSRRATQLAGGWYPGATKQLAAAGGNHPNAETDRHGTQYQYAAAAQPQAAGSGLVQLAGGWHPQAETDQTSQA